jgi:ribosomal-protein-alanine N-acetyltransferase
MLSNNNSQVSVQEPTSEHLALAYELFCLHRAVPWSFELFTQSIMTPFSLLAIQDDALVGYVIVSQRLDEAEIEDICVSELYRQRGIGASLLTGTLARLNKAKVDSVYLEVRQSNVSAQRLYRQLGFSVTGERKNYYSNRDGSQESAMLYQWLGGR